MFKGIRVLCICAILAGVLVPGLALAQEAPAVPGVMADAVQAPEPNMSQDEKPFTLEEIKQMFGPHNVCGAYCGGRPVKNCSELCGDHAVCWNGYCLFA